MYCAKCGTYMPDDSKYCPGCGEPVANMVKPEYPTLEMPMKWHKFLCYFALWLNALVNVSNASQAFTGQLSEGLEWVPGMRLLAIFLGIFSIVFALFCVHTALGLIGYRKEAPKNLLRLYMMAFSVDLLSNIVLMALLLNVGVGEEDVAYIVSQTIGATIVNLAMYFINKVYYGKRMHMFVN